MAKFIIAKLVTITDEDAGIRFAVNKFTSCFRKTKLNKVELTPNTIFTIHTVGHLQISCLRG